MKVHLMYIDEDFNRENRPERPTDVDLVQDLELDMLFQAMAGDDEFLYGVARAAVLASLDDPEPIGYRQLILQDWLANRELLDTMYQIATSAVERRRWQYHAIGGSNPEFTLTTALEDMHDLVSALKALRRVLELHAEDFQSDGLTRFAAMTATELSEEYFAEVEDQLRRLRFRDGILISARLGHGNEGLDYVLRKPSRDRPNWLDRLTGAEPPSYTYTLPPRDEAGGQVLGNLRGRGLNLVANAVAQSADHIRGFFRALREELGFYVGCLSLHDHLADNGEPIVMPTPLKAYRAGMQARDLHDPCLSLKLHGKTVGNDVDALDKALIMITGANQGGKSTLLRALGVTNLMMQCGMFVTAESFTAGVCSGVYTHFKREEDALMVSGKFDEELSRMNDLAETITPHSLILFNESFAATNEREGSAIAREILRALLDRDVRAIYVTHLYDLAHRLFEQGDDKHQFLRAERGPEGKRTYKLREGEPLPTSYGADLYSRIFGTSLSQLAQSSER